MRLKYIFLFLISFNLFATPQQNDLILYNGQQSELELNLGSISPLVAYFEDGKAGGYPFKELHTGNYRGHVASWEILNNKLYLNKITVPKWTFDKNRNRTLEIENRVELDEVLPKRLISNSKAFATWFTGHLLIKSGPFKKEFKSEYGDVEHYVIEFKEYSVIQIKDGEIVHETTYDSKDFWDLTNRYLAFKSINKDDLRVLNEFYNYGSNFVQIEEDDDRNQLVYSEDDFEVFLEREYKHKVKVPLAQYCIITDVSIDTNGNGWFGEGAFRIEKGSNVLYLEMGSTNIPNGPWNDHTGGSVQILIPLQKLGIDKIVNSDNVRYINNFARFDSPKSIVVNLSVSNVKNDSVKIEGAIELKSKEPETYQKIDFEGQEVPVYTLLEYLKKYQNQSEYFSYDADEVYEEIQNKSLRE